FAYGNVRLLTGQHQQLMVAHIEHPGAEGKLLGVDRLQGRRRELEAWPVGGLRWHQDPTRRPTVFKLWKVAHGPSLRPARRRAKDHCLSKRQAAPTGELQCPDSPRPWAITTPSPTPSASRIITSLRCLGPPTRTACSFCRRRPSATHRMSPHPRE